MVEHRSRPKSEWWFKSSLLMVGVVIGIELLTHTPLKIADPSPILIITVVYLALRSGIRSAFASTVIGWLYLAYSYSIPGTLFQYTAENLTSVILWAAALPIVVALVNRYRTEQQRRLVMHQRAEEKFRALVEAAPDATVVVSMEGKIELVNQQMENLFGYARSDLLGQPVEVLMPETYLSRHVTHRTKYVLDPHTRPMGSGLELSGLHRDGHSFAVEISLSPIRLEQETLISAAVRDVSERKQVEEALRQNEERYRMISQLMSDDIYSCIVEPDGEFRLEWIIGTFTEITGFKPEEIGSTFRLYHAEDAVQAAQDVKRVIAGDTVDSQYRIVTKEGETRWFEIRRFPVVDPQTKRVVRFYGAAQDVTERKEMEEQQLRLRIEQERVDILKHFLSAASHDLRTPLSIMVTSLYLLRKAPDAERRLNHMQNLEQQIELIEKQLEDMFTLMRLDLADSEFRFESCEFNALVTDIKDQHEALAQRNQQQIVMKLDPNLPRILADIAELELALKNLVENALNYTPDGGVITLRTSSQEGNILLEIRDTGIGMNASEITQIFERFYRADKARGSGTGSSGLGLPIAKKIIEAHHGTIEVESTPVRAACSG